MENMRSTIFIKKADVSRVDFFQTNQIRTTIEQENSRVNRFTVSGCRNDVLLSERTKPISQRLHKYFAHFK